MTDSGSPSMAEVEVVEDFFGVYLLYCINPKFKGRTYIGYTRDPNRRIKQHNRGTWAGGAHRTSNRGPWKMVMIVHGFPNNISALRFEWAWQNPNTTTRLQHLNLKKIPRKESEFQFKLRILSEMLRVGPWCRLPLAVRWLEKDFSVDFPAERLPPSHMSTCYGPVKIKNLKKQPDNSSDICIECLLCSQYIYDSRTKIMCLNTECELVAHITCMADYFLESGEYVPIQGQCSFCNTTLNWGDLIRKMNGCSLEGVKETAGNTDGAEESENDSEDKVCSQSEGIVDEHSWMLDCNEDL